ncbi:Hypothetical protein PFR_JS7-2_2054 [Propionibacterium freudenreichii]|nr:Hypothetical protein PFR_JS7-1_2111 [Propionibacterium freudenreichii]SCQ54948.1 Hypothetical protein PFR_JS7-2_2054 [Propionibacterium freudenreichii]
MRGLFGELWVLSLLAKQNPFFALDSWRGPRGDAHDFIAPRGQLEVKSSKREGLDVTISSLAQLDRAPGTSLGLVRLHIDSSPDGQGIDDMVEKLTGMGCPRATVIESIGAMGFLVGVDADDFRFIVPTPPLAWHVTDDFPGLRSTDLPEDRREAITQLKYSLNLIGAPGQMSSDEFDSYTEAMMSK